MRRGTSLSRDIGQNVNNQNSGGNIPCLSPILGSPSKAIAMDRAGRGNQQLPYQNAIMPYDQGGMTSAPRCVTVPENLCSLTQQPLIDPTGFRHHSNEFLQQQQGFVVDRHNVVLNYDHGQTGATARFAERSSSLNSLCRRHSLTGCLGGKENVAPDFDDEPPPDLSEETILAPEHNEVLAKLKFIHQVRQK